MATKRKQDRMGMGASEPERGRSAAMELERRLGMPLIAGYGKCAITIGLDAAEKLNEILASHDAAREILRKAVKS